MIFATINKLNSGSIEVVFNDLENHKNVQIKSMTLDSASDIYTIYHELNDGLTLLMRNGRQFPICAKNSPVENYIIIEAVNDTIPTSNTHLKELLQQLKTI